MLQALLVVPAFGLVYLVAAPAEAAAPHRGSWSSAAVAFIVSAGWWVAIVELSPASARPYIGGSQNNSVLNLIFGYNGFGRLTGNETGSVGGGGGGTGSMWGADGLAAAVQQRVRRPGVVAAAGRADPARRPGWPSRGGPPRTDRTRAALILWGGWLLVTGVTFSLGQGIIHPYYTVALAPAIGAVVGIGAAALWRRRHELARPHRPRRGDRRHRVVGACSCSAARRTGTRGCDRS